MSTTVEDLEIWIDEMMKKMEIAKYKLDLSGSTSKGDGYLGEVNFIKVVASEDNGEEKVYDVVVKSANKSEEFRKQTPIQEAYHREMFMYTKVFPIFEEFQRDYALTTVFDSFTKCYSVCRTEKKEALILKNLKILGFEIHDRMVPQNLNHALFVFRNYGRLHGTSLALKIKKPGLFQSLTKNMTNVFGQFILQAGMVELLTEDFRQSVELLKGDGKTAIAEKLKCLEGDIGNALTKMTGSDRREAVILHGDCWNNNMMFKYKDGNTTQPIDMRFIDFQLSRSLTDFLKQFGIISDDIVTLKELKEQWKTFGKFGLAITPFIIKIELCQKDEVVDLAASAEKGDVRDALKVEIKDRGEFERRIKDVFEHFAESST
ncbi:hypothetical protein JTB14_018470 [Gonioctena quinquepunctata]|nr:hypothetical protein JTB14_018470 [Gonioctena quinquepunctata]